MIDDEPVVADDADEVVRKVRRGSALQLAESNLAGLRRRAGQIQAEIAALVEAKRQMLVPEHASSIDADLQRLAAEHASLGPTIAPAFAAVTAARTDYDNRVTSALAPTRRAATIAALAAAEDLRAAIGLFDSCNAAARRVGAPEMRRPKDALSWLDEIFRNFSQRIE